MTTLDNFEQRVAEIVTRIEQNADKIVRKVAMAADNAIVMATPVDTGRARANWIASLDAPTFTATENKDKSGGSALAQMASVIASWDGKTNSSIHITNNLPYISSLNSGTSVQASAGFVQAGVRAAAKAIKGSHLLEGI